MKIIIAIDPGASGGISVLTTDGVAQCWNMPETDKDVLDLLKPHCNMNGEPQSSVRCFVEKVSGFAGSGQPGSSMFRFGEGFGAIKGFLMALEVPFEEVTPQRWMKALALGTAGAKAKPDKLKLKDDSTRKEELSRVSKINYAITRDWKNKLKNHAQQLYPSLKVTLSTADP